MKNKKMSFSLRYKLLILLTVLPLISLSLYLLMATDLFEKDKMAYVYDANASSAKSLSIQTRLEYNAFLDRVGPIIEGYNYQDRIFSSLALSFFKSQKKIDALVLLQKGDNGNFFQLGALNLGSKEAQAFLQNSALIEFSKNEAYVNGSFISSFNHSDMHTVLASKIGESKDSTLIVVALYKSKDLVKSFSVGTGLYSSYFLNYKGNYGLGLKKKNKLSEKEKMDKILSPIYESKLPEGTLQTEVDGKAFIISFANTGIGKSFVTSVVDKSYALKAVEMLVVKSLVFFVALIASTVIISLFASVELTSTLRELYEATRTIAKGNFDVRVQSKSKDEVGGLAEGFNLMAEEVSRLMEETAEKARMSSELETVKTVQETFFPPEKSKFGPLNIMGHFEPASECGGDWWYYSQVGDKIYLWIGDATGHGTPAALVTSAAKSAAAIIESLPDMTPSKALRMMNRAIYETSKGKIMMTFFLAAIDTKTGIMTYANASHEPPFLVSRRNDGEKISKKDLNPLMEVNGPRLGDQKESDYPEKQVQLKEGDTILFYTDGVVDLQDSKGATWGERKFLKAIIDSVSNGENVEDKVSVMKNHIEVFRENSLLVDDITYFVCQYQQGDAA